MAFVGRTVGWLATFGAAIIAFLATATDGCDDGPATEPGRCTSFLGNGTADWSFVWPAAIGLAVGTAVWILIGVLVRFWRTQQAALADPRP